jgi:hydroxyacylglutathione hydrolase
MGLQIERIPTWRDNYTYLVICDQTREAAIVDAPEAKPVIDRVEQTGARVTKILSTHHHPDHSMANPELAKHFDAPVYGHHSDAGRLPGLTVGIDEGDEV